VRLPIYFGNRNWKPFLEDAVTRMRDDGVQHALALITSAYSSFSGCRQYREDIERARAAVTGAPPIAPLRRFFNHPGFVDACIARTEDALTELRESAPAIGEAQTRIVFTAHSIPTSMAAACDYEVQLRANAELIAERFGLAWDMVWQSRSGPPQVPWLEPDVLVHLRALAAGDTQAVVIAPIGFLSDHLEVLYDLDVEAKALAGQLGLTLVRAKTAGVHPRLVEGLGQLVAERLSGGPVLSVGPLPARPERCAFDCCPRPARPGAVSATPPRDEP
jgi:ferrochelatase